MLIDKPQCNFKNCRYCFDGNCMSADKYENCKLTDLHYEIAKLTVDLDNAKGEGELAKFEVNGKNYGRVYYQYKECPVNETQLFPSPYHFCPNCGAKMKGV